MRRILQTEIGTLKVGQQCRKPEKVSQFHTVTTKISRQLRGGEEPTFTVIPQLIAYVSNFNTQSATVKEIV